MKGKYTIECTLLSYFSDDNKDDTICVNRGSKGIRYAYMNINGGLLLMSVNVMVVVESK